jgi:hypothetical protein
LEEFGIQGTNGLILGKLKHPHLKKLCIQTSGMQRDTLTAIWKADLPALEHLELWLGLRSYGATVTVEDFDQLFAGQRFPHLKYLGLRNTELTEELAEAISTAPILETLQTLDLSLGLFGDESAQRFLASKLDQGLYKLDVHHHYCSNEMMQQLQQLPLEIDLSDPKTDKVFTADFERHKLLNPAAKRHRLHSIQVHFNRLRQWLQDKMKFKHQPVHTQETNGS